MFVETGRDSSAEEIPSPHEGHRMWSRGARTSARRSKYLPTGTGPCPKTCRRTSGTAPPLSAQASVVVFIRVPIGTKGRPVTRYRALERKMRFLRFP